MPDRFENYIPVSERIEQFYAKFPDGRILTTIVEHDTEGGFILMRAEAYRKADDSLPAATGHAFEMKAEGYVNKTSYIENCETGAVGRALANLGFEVKRGIASREDTQKTDRQTPARTAPATNTPSKIDQNITQALQILNKGDKDLNGWVKTKLGLNCTWQRLKDSDKEQALLFLNSKVNQEAAAK